MKKNFFYLIFLLFLFPKFALAAGPFSSSKIQAIAVHDFGTAILVGLTASATNSEGCSNNSLLVLKKDHPSFKEAYAAILSAFQANNSLTGWVNGCDPSFGAPILIRIDLSR